MANGFGRMPKEATVVEYEAVPTDLPEGTEKKKTGNLSHDIRCLSQDSNLAPQKYESQVLPTEPPCSVKKVY